MAISIVDGSDRVKVYPIAEVGEGTVDDGHVSHAHFSSAQSERGAVAVGIGPGSDAELLAKGEHFFYTVTVKHFDGRDVERGSESGAEGDQTMILAIVVSRGVGRLIRKGEGDRRVINEACCSVLWS